MRKFLLLIICLIAFQTRAQEKPLYYEKVGLNTFRFFFDKNYFLADKSCEFKSIERVSKLNPKTQHFDGPFKDFNNFGRLILEGNYIDGVKQGLFKAYHANGKLKWEANFVNDSPKGEIKHYYTNQQLAIKLQSTDSLILIQDFYEPNGTQKITNGNGNYSFSIPFEGYNNYGVEFYSVRGKIKNGLQDGEWNIYGFNKGQKELLIATENYKDGNIKEQVSNYFTPFVIFPYTPFTRAESLIFKGCTFDDFSGFNIQMSNSFTRRASMLTIPDFTEEEFEYVTQINKNGIPSSDEIIKKTSSEILNQTILNHIEAIQFYYPSLLSGEQVEDKLTIKGKIIKNEEGKLLFLPINIHREKGQ